MGQVASAFELVDSKSRVVEITEGWARLLLRFLVPSLGDPRGPVLVQDGGRWILSGTNQADHIQLMERDGRFVVRVGRLDDDGNVVYGEELPLTDEQAANLVIRSGDGNDVIEVPTSSRLKITVWTGDGDDMVGAASANPGVRVGGGGDERIFLGQGDDVAFGGGGRDEVYGGGDRDVVDSQDGDDRLVGGDGFDILYGGRGDDRLDGGRGTDYMEGGSGGDVLHGRSGDDMLSGGRGDDRLSGGSGDDRLFGGRGEDVVGGGHGRDVSMDERGDRRDGVEEHITIELVGDPGSQAIVTPKPEWMSDAEYQAWLERIDSDLELIRTTPAGRAGLEALDSASRDSDHNWLPFFDSDRHIVVVPYGDTENIAAGPNGRPYSVADWMAPAGGSGSLPGSYASPPGGAVDDDALVSYGDMHSRALDDRPPPVSLYHELSHSYDQISGGTEDGEYTEVLVDRDGNEIDRRTAPRAEINSVGLDVDSDGRIDTRPSDGGRDHPEELTENSLRDDLGWRRRPSYTLIPDEEAGQEVVFEVED